MARPWVRIAEAETADGRLELRQRGAGDFLILHDGRVLMNSAQRRSEEALARVACEPVAGPAPRVLVGGLGMACTLRAALDALPSAARVRVVEKHPVIVDWCRGPLAELTERAVEDARVELQVGDVAQAVAQSRPPDARFDAIVLDLNEGPHARSDAVGDPFYGSRALAHTRAALRPGGVFAVWSEDPDAGFERRLEAAGFRVERLRPGRGGRRHAVYRAQLEAGA
ncbi:MAG: spermidine synthase [Proteobacteria bacterium]|nr:spermidine synthase [Pseudomonadota bacterium]